MAQILLIFIFAKFPKPAYTCHKWLKNNQFDVFFNVRDALMSLPDDKSWQGVIRTE